MESDLSLPNNPTFLVFYWSKLSHRAGSADAELYNKQMLWTYCRCISNSMYLQTLCGHKFEFITACWEFPGLYLWENRCVQSYISEYSATCWLRCVKHVTTGLQVDLWNDELCVFVCQFWVWQLERHISSIRFWLLFKKKHLVLQHPKRFWMTYPRNFERTVTSIQHDCTRCIKTRMSTSGVDLNLTKHFSDESEERLRWRSVGPTTNEN